MLSSSPTSTNPSSCDSSAAQTNCNFQASTSASSPSIPTASETFALTTAKCNENSSNTSSPALANSVPPFQEPHYPEPSGQGVIYFTSELANKAAEEYELEKFDSIVQWYYRNQERLQQLDRFNNCNNKSSTGSPSDNGYSEESQKEGAPDRSGVKRKLSDDSEEPVVKRFLPANEHTTSDQNISEENNTCVVNNNEQSSSEEENPLRRMELMTNSTAFSSATGISDAICDAKKDDRPPKLEKMGGLEKESVDQKCRPLSQQPQSLQPPISQPPQYPPQPSQQAQQAHQQHQHQMHMQQLQQQHHQMAMYHQQMMERQRMQQSMNSPSPFIPMTSPAYPGYPPPNGFPPHPAAFSPAFSPMMHHQPGIPRPPGVAPSPGAFPMPGMPGYRPIPMMHPGHPMYAQHRGLIPPPGRSPSVAFPHGYPPTQFPPGYFPPNGIPPQHNQGALSGPVPYMNGPPSGVLAAPNSAPPPDKGMNSPYAASPLPKQMGQEGPPGGMLVVSQGKSEMDNRGHYPSLMADPNSLPGFAPPYSAVSNNIPMGVTQPQSCQQ